MTYKGAVTLGFACLALVTVAALVTRSNVLASQGQTADEQSEQTMGPPARAAESNQAPVAAVNHILKGTYINTCLPSCDIFTLAANTSIALDAPTTIICPAAVGSTCTITDTAWLQSQNTGSNGNNAGALQLVIDGTTVDFNLSGGSPANAFYFDGLYSKISVATGVSRGTHTVQTQARSVKGANGSAWTAKYEVYTP
jgi:hypothetical protein